MFKRVEFRGVWLDIEYTYYPGCQESMSGPAEPEDIAIQRAEVLGIDVKELLCQDYYEELCDKILELRAEDELEAQIDQAKDR